ncbi:arylesterase [Gilvimarinus sp. F26214L]|uniref:arylesterase n=1 Tax=Gilvimarinus sp. DZF01 TaxID=3461371 RepID=UPI0040466F56
MRIAVVLFALLFSSTVFSKTILVIGDSISAGYGVELEDGWVNLLRQRVQEFGEYEVVNASISGNTTTMGVGRTPALLKKHAPDIVIIELGGNDGLQGHPLKVVERNLSQMVRMSRESGADVLLVGIQIPPNYGRRYTEEFFSTFTTVAEKFDVPLVPFILDKVATEDGLMQADGVHPTTEAQPILLENVWPYLEPLL